MDIDWKELGIQVAVGALVGAGAVMAATNDLTKAVFAAILVGALRGAAQAFIAYKTPKTTAANKKIWVDKAEKWKRYF